VALNAARHRRLIEWLPLSHADLADGTMDPAVAGSIPPRPEWPVPDFTASVAERDAVWSVLAQLPPRWRAVLLLQTTGGFDVGEIATLLGLSDANVRKMLFRAKERFRVLHARLAAKEGRA
jgi:DNA-directed RNA polymerase specialized sigma24 family protein